MLSKLSLDDLQKPILIYGGVIAGGILAYYLYNNYVKSNNFDWEEVGEISKLLIHPIKSAGNIDVNKAYASKYGLSRGNNLDRSFIVLNGDTMVTGRDMPKLLTISPEIEEGTLTLTSLEGKKFILEMAKVVSKNRSITFKIRCTTVQGLDCGEDVGKWLTNVLNTEKKQIRLVYKGFNDWDRPARKFPAKFNNMGENDTTVYQDSGVYMVMTESSIDDLNSRLKEPVDVYYFRPPILIKGTLPYDEDTWSYVKIGKSVLLRVFKPCERCLLTQRVPSTGEERTDHFEVLKSYRCLTWPPDIAKQMKGRPILGAQCGIDRVGEISVGDKVFVCRQKVPWWKIG